jgi:hydrogenase 3 maturation protease
MQALSTSVQASLKGASRVAVIGIGSDLRGDDIAGILAVQELEKTTKRSKLTVPLLTLLGYTAPENMTGEIRKFAPSHLIMIDTAEIGGKPGSIEVFPPEKTAGMTFSTHKLPVKIMAEYLSASVKCSVIIIGIQPKVLDFGSAVTKEVEAAAKQVSSIIKDALSAD